MTGYVAVERFDPARYDEQHAGVCGSGHAAAACGVSPFESRLHLWARWRGVALAPEEETDAMWWGREIQPAILRRAEKQLSCRVEPCDMILRSTLHPRMVTTPDGRVGTGRLAGWLVEAKDSERRDICEEAGPPEDWEVQSQHHLAVIADAPGVLLAVRRGRGPLILWEVPRDPETEEWVVAQEADLWRRVEANDPPPPDDSDSSASALRSIYPRDAGPEIAIADPALVEAACREDELKEMINRAKKERDGLRNAILAAMGEAGRARVGDALYRRKACHRSGYEVGPCDYIDLRRVQR